MNNEHISWLMETESIVPLENSDFKGRSVKHNITNYILTRYGSGVMHIKEENKRLHSVAKSENHVIPRSFLEIHVLPGNLSINKKCQSYPYQKNLTKTRGEDKNKVSPY